MRSLLISLLFLSGLAHAEWSDQDRVLFGVSSALLIVDWGQTRTIVKQPERYYERNPILGKHPSMSRVNTNFAVALAGNYLLTDWLSPKWRTRYQAGLIGLELVVVGNNKRIGIGLSF